MSRKQRTREEILQECSKAVRNSAQASYWYTKQSVTQEAMLEVLLDIRDQLTVIKQVMPESDQFVGG